MFLILVLVILISVIGGSSMAEPPRARESRSDNRRVEQLLGGAAGSLVSWRCAFTRIHLAAGESKTVTLHLAERQLQYWSPTRHQWVLPKAVAR